MTTDARIVLYAQTGYYRKITSDTNEYLTTQQGFVVRHYRNTWSGDKPRMGLGVDGISHLGRAKHGLKLKELGFKKINMFYSDTHMNYAFYHADDVDLTRFMIVADKAVPKVKGA